MDGFTVRIRSATEQDLAELSGWFETESDVKNWGGPAVHFPLGLEQLKIDIAWDTADSYSLVDESRNLLGFGQAFFKYGCRHLGRIVLSPKIRGRKLGEKLMTALLNSTSTDGLRFSLFVFEDNIPAKRLYESMGFAVQPYPSGMSNIKGCIFMIKGV